MVKAYNDGLSFKKIAVLFKRNWRSVKNVIESGKTGSLDLSILMPGLRVIDFRTDEYARLVRFRIGNTVSNIIVVQKICLDVIESAKHDRGPRLEAAIQPYKYDMELRLGKVGECSVTDVQFKLPRNEIDDFELLCTSEPGTVYRARVKIYYSEHPSSTRMSICSEEFHLEFPKVEKRIDGKPNRDFKFVRATTPRDYLRHLASFMGSLSQMEDGELRLYLSEPLTDETVKAIEEKLTACGVYLHGHIQQETRVLCIRFRYGEATTAAISSIEVPNLIGWQLFNSQGKCMKGLTRYGNDEAAIIEG
jgi:hypothetical protein